MRHQHGTNPQEKRQKQGKNLTENERVNLQRYGDGLSKPERIPREPHTNLEKLIATLFITALACQYIFILPKIYESFLSGDPETATQTEGEKSIKNVYASLLQAANQGKIYANEVCTPGPIITSP